jgi:glycosyltransferase involved in cell wall biosynthesis
MSDVYLSTCNYLDDRLQEYGANRSSIIRYILPFDRKRVDMPISDKGYFVFLGQCIQEKGVGLLYDIVKRCPETNFIFLFFGGEKKQIDKFGLNNLGNRVQIYTDKRWDSGVADILAGARGVLLPSIWPTVTETVLLEAIGLRKPVIAFDVGIHSEILEHGKNAMVYSLGDLDGFCESIRLLNTEDRCREKLSNGARELFYRLTSPEKLESTLKAAYFA